MKADKRKLDIAMARACISTAELVIAAGMKRPTVNNVIVGREVKPATIGKIARALGCDVTDIIEE